MWKHWHAEWHVPVPQATSCSGADKNLFQAHLASQRGSDLAWEWVVLDHRAPGRISDTDAVVDAHHCSPYKYLTQIHELVQHMAENSLE